MTARTRTAWLVAVLVVLCAAMFGHGGTVFAHPLGNFTMNRYARIEVYRDAIDLHYVVDMAEIPTVQLISAIDEDGDGRASQSELDAYAATEARELARGFTLAVSGDRLAPAPVDISIQLLPGQGGLQVTRLVVVYRAPLTIPAGERVAVRFADSNFADRAGWKEIVVRPSEGADVVSEPGLSIDRSNALLSYPAETLRSAPNQREAAFTWVVGTGSLAPAVAAPQVAASGRSGGGVAMLLQRQQSLGIVVLSLLAAFGFGMLHALGPGHGKTVVAAYLVGSRGTARDALALGLTVTATHTSTVYLLGFVTLAASAYIIPETLYLYLGVASGVMVVAMGGALLAGRLSRALGRRSPEGTHSHGLFAKPHRHDIAHDDDHGRAQDLHANQGRAPAVTWRSLLALGVAGGVVPCPSAIVVMLAAISLGQVVFGMLLIVAFSLGLAGVLTGIGLALVLGKRLSGRYGSTRLASVPALARALAALPVLSAFAVTLAGLAITYQAWTRPGL